MLASFPGLSPISGIGCVLVSFPGLSPLSGIRCVLASFPGFSPVSGIGCVLASFPGLSLGFILQQYLFYLEEVWEQVVLNTINEYILNLSHWTSFIP